MPPGTDALLEVATSSLDCRTPDSGASPLFFIPNLPNLFIIKPVARSRNASSLLYPPLNAADIPAEEPTSIARSVISSAISFATLFEMPYVFASTGANSLDIEPAPANVAFIKPFCKASFTDLPLDKSTAVVPVNAAAAFDIVFFALTILAFLPVLIAVFTLDNAFSVLAAYLATLSPRLPHLAALTANFAAAI